jgi:hypothetical protein
MFIKSNQAQAQLQQIVSPIVSALRQGLGDNLVAVVLYGSRAREDATKASDWDLFVLAHNLPSNPLQRHFQLTTLLPVEWRGQASLLSLTPEQFEARITSLMLDIALDGIVLDDPQGYATERLEALKELLESKGLYRTQQGKDFIWKWKRFPGCDWTLEWREARRFST